MKNKAQQKTFPFLFFVPFELKKKLNQSHIFFLFQSFHIKLKQFNDAWIEKLNLSLNFKNSRHDRRMWEGREDRIWCIKRKGFYEVTSDEKFLWKFLQMAPSHIAYPTWWIYTMSAYWSRIPAFYHKPLTHSLYITWQMSSILVNKNVCVCVVSIWWKYVWFSAPSRERLHTAHAYFSSCHFV